MSHPVFENKEVSALSSQPVTSSSRIHKICNQSIYSFNDDETKIIVHSLAGIEKQILNLGVVGSDMNINGHFLAVTCVPATLKIYDLSRREAKQVVHKDVLALMPDVGTINAVSVNCAGNRVAFLAEDSTGNCDGNVYIYYPDRQKVFSEAKVQRASERFDSPDSGFGIESRELVPVCAKWDEKDSKLLSVQYRKRLKTISHSLPTATKTSDIGYVT